ncbi:MAG: hypothetical protein SNH35_02425 [Rikenellaceae bacterium]
MQNNKIVRWVMVCVVALFATTLSAQTTSTRNTYSIYSMYGIGDILTPGSLPSRSMGGTGVASRSSASINLLNPASYSIAIRKGILFDIGAEASLVTNTQNNAQSSYWAANLHNISLQIPVAKGMGIGFGISPYSTVGYYLNDYEKVTDMGLLTYNYNGSGEIIEANLGFGITVTKGLSLGVAVKYYWGLLDRYYSLSVLPITTSASYSTTQGLEGTYISKLKAQFGVQWDLMMTTSKRFTLGATYDLGGNISPAVDMIVTSGSAGDIVEITARDVVEYPVLNFPHQVNVGATYRDRKWQMAADFTYQAWAGNDITLTAEGVEVAYANNATLKMGVEYLPSRADTRYYYKRMSYRGGLRLGNYYQTFGGEILPQWAATAGVGFPISLFGMSNLDLGIEYSGLGSTKTVNTGSNSMNLIRQNCVKVSVGLTLFGDDYWFQRVKYD